MSNNCPLLDVCRLLYGSVATTGASRGREGTHPHLSPKNKSITRKSCFGSLTTPKRQYREEGENTPGTTFSLGLPRMILLAELPNIYIFQITYAKRLYLVELGVTKRLRE